jgi:D-xylose 1-dehydrogenase (NADP+, D-xylono-1,5-lactone-forming)
VTARRSTGRHPSEAVRWGFVGVGAIARRALGPAVHCADGAVLQAAAARDLSRAQSLSPVGRVYDSYEALMGDPEVDAVYISLNNDAHLPWTLAALDAGKHVLCEKPLGLTAAEVERMAAAAERADRMVVEATWSRWHPRTLRAEALILTGALGTVTEVDSGFTFSAVPADSFRLDPTQGGGALYDVGPYAVGAALWALPDGPVEVLSSQVTRHAGGVDLTTRTRLRVGDAIVSVHMSVDEPAGQWVRITGEAGSLSLDAPAHTSWFDPSTLSATTAAGPMLLQFAPVDPYQVMVEHVSRAIRGDPSAHVLPLEESLRVAQAIDAIREADA